MLVGRTAERTRLKELMRELASVSGRTRALTWASRKALVESGRAREPVILAACGFMWERWLAVAGMSSLLAPYVDRLRDHPRPQLRAPFAALGYGSDVGGRALRGPHGKTVEPQPAHTDRRLGVGSRTGLARPVPERLETR